MAQEPRYEYRGLVVRGVGRIGTEQRWGGYEGGSNERLLKKAPRRARSRAQAVSATRELRQLLLGSQ